MVCGLVLVVFAFSCWGETIIVDQNGSADFDNIQDAIDYSWDGDTVIVKRGVYPEDIFFNSRAITLTSENPNDPNTVAATIINGTITFDFGEREDSILRGFAVATQKEFAICTATGTQTYPAIYGNTVVWEDGRSGTFDIYGYDLVTKQEFAICTATGNQNNPAIYGNTVVWQDYRNSSNYPDIYGYDLVTKQAFAICTATGSQNYPTIYDNTVVWADNRSGNYDIYGYDLVTQHEFAICIATGNQTYPAIYGNTVVWGDYRSGSGNTDIYGYDLVTKQEFAICTATGSQTYPAIYGNTVVWEDYRSGSSNADIYGYDLVTKQEFAICTATNSQAFPAIYVDTVVWSDYRSGTLDIYANTSFNIPRVIGDGVVCYDSFPTVAQNRFLNFEMALGCYANAMPRVQNNAFVKNGTAIIDCNATISSNSFEDDGIAMQNCSGTITNNNIIHGVTSLSRCTGIITHNVITYSQTGMSNCSGAITDNIVTANTIGFYNCTGSFKNNLVTANAKSFQSCSGIISNNTITGSKEYALYQNSATIKNNIIAFNQVGISGVSSNSYNCFWGNTGGNFADGAYAKTGDFFADPKFASNGVWLGDVWQEGDYHLKSTAGRYDLGTETWVFDDVNSFCIDRGDPGDPIGYEPNPNGSRINVGNYGGTAEASKSTNGSGPEPPTTCTSPVEGDLNNDCKVDYEDFAIMASHWLECNLNPPEACFQ
jgi:beta propeller repeat protein